MSLPPYQISWKSTQRFKSYLWGTQTDRQTGDLIGLLSFLESRLEMSVLRRVTVPAAQLDVSVYHQFVVTGDTRSEGLFRSNFYKKKYLLHTKLLQRLAHSINS
jgi:hypothetical protein